MIADLHPFGGQANQIIPGHIPGSSYAVGIDEQGRGKAKTTQKRQGSREKRLVSIVHSQDHRALGEAPVRIELL